VIIRNLSTGYPDLLSHGVGMFEKGTLESCKYGARGISLLISYTERSVPTGSPSTPMRTIIMLCCTFYLELGRCLALGE
jgi:hypothetical protein